MHIEKYGITQVAKLYQHYFREHITDNVDTTKTKNNQTWYEDKVKDYFENNKQEINSKTITEYINNYISQNVKRKVRADSVIMCDLIITQPKEYGTELNQDFFDKCIDAFDKHYLNGNAVSVSIHQDEEGQPHCHISFIPITKDGRLSAKDYIGIMKNKKGIEPIINLNKFHEQMEQYTGYKLTVEDNTIKNLSMAQYKLKKINEDIERIEKKYNDLITKYNNKAKEYDDLSIKLNDNYRQWQNQNDIIDDQKKEIDEYEKIKIEKENEINNIINQNELLQKIIKQIKDNEKENKKPLGMILKEITKLDNLNDIKNELEKLKTDHEYFYNNTIKKYILPQFENQKATDDKKLNSIKNELQVWTRIIAAQESQAPKQTQTKGITLH